MVAGFISMVETPAKITPTTPAMVMTCGSQPNWLVARRMVAARVNKATQIFSMVNPRSESNKPPATGSKVCQRLELAISGMAVVMVGIKLLVTI